MNTERILPLRPLANGTAVEPSPFPHIVTGPRRTGTTLLAGILCSDPQANELGQEAQIVTRLVEAYRWGRVNFRDFGSSFFTDRDQYCVQVSKVLAGLLREVADRVSPGPALVLKNPEFSLVALEIAELLPTAVFVATVRDPRDQVASELEVGARRATDGLADQTFEHRDVATLSQHYLDYCSGLLKLRDRSPERILLLRYEDLVRSPQQQLADLKAFTGLTLPFDPSRPWPRVSPLAALHEGPSRSDLYGRPLTERSVGRFSRDLTSSEVTIIERVCAGLMRSFGYLSES